MQDMKKNIRRVFWLFFALFLTVVLYLGKFILVDSAGIINSTYNPRLNRNDFSIKRGMIYDFDGNILAESVPEGGQFKRVYPRGRAFAHTAGFIHTTKAGAEAKYNFSLNNLDLEVFQRIRNLVDGTPLQGDNIRLTLDLAMQEYAYESLGQVKGGIVVMEPNTGRVMAMAASPGFDPNDIGNNWDTLSADEDNSPLLNRATQGLYPPGSVFKIVTADAIMEHMPDYEDFYYECKGTAVFGDDQIRCYDTRAHGTVNLHTAIQYSCNTYFSAVLMEIGYDKLVLSAEKMGFNNSYPFDLEHVSSRFNSADTIATGEIIQTAIGQGKTLVTPLHMAMITSAVANGGLMMEPYICEDITSYYGRVKRRAAPSAIGQVFSGENAAALKSMMLSAVEAGTGTQAKVSGLAIAGKTGTAQNASGDDHGWFVGFAPVDNPEITIAVVTENTDGTRKAMAIAKGLFELYNQ